MMVYQIRIEDRAVLEIQDIINYYNYRQKGLGRKFNQDLNQCIDTLKKNPFFRIRYNSVRCLPLTRFPYMVHFVVEKDLVSIYAVIATRQNPDTSYLYSDNF